MRKSIFTTRLISLGLLVLLIGCRPLNLSETQVITTQDIASTQVTISPTPPSDEQKAVDQAMAYLGDKMSNLVLDRVRNIGIDGKSEYRVDFQQVHQDLPVYLAGASVFVPTDGKAIWSNGAYYPDVFIESTNPKVSQEMAVQNAVEYVGIQADYSLLQSPQLVIFPVFRANKIHREGVYVLAWELVISTVCPLGHWATIVNAYDGTILALYNQVLFKAPIDDKCATPVPLPTVTRAPSRTPSFTPYPPTPEATMTIEPYPGIKTETAPAPTEITLTPDIVGTAPVSTEQLSTPVATTPSP